MLYQAPRWVTRYSKRGIPHHVLEPDMPRIDVKLLESVVYLYPSEADAEEGVRAGGSGFLIGIPIPTDKPLGNLLCIVTNKHVIDGGSAVVRVNTRDGKTDIISLDEQKWFHHPGGDDLAICPIGLNEKHKCAFIGANSMVPRKYLEQLEIGVGDDVFMVGRFVDREGKSQNQPCIRFGNIAQYGGDPIVLEDTAQETILVEAHSIAGFSGSPVFVYVPAPPPLPPLPDWVKEDYYDDYPNLFHKSRPRVGLPIGPYLLGIDYCHIFSKTPVMSEKTGKPMNDWYVEANTGMMGVIPVWRLYDIIDGEEMMAIRKDAEKEIRQREIKSGVSLDVAKDVSAPSSDENPTHREDFTNLLNEAAKTRSQGD